MPITEEQMTHEQMKLHERKGFVCKECSAPLMVAWGGAHGYNSYILSMRRRSSSKP